MRTTKSTYSTSQNPKFKLTIKYWGKTQEVIYCDGYKLNFDSNTLDIMKKYESPVGVMYFRTRSIPLERVDTIKETTNG